MEWSTTTQKQERANLEQRSPSCRAVAIDSAQSADGGFEFTYIIDLGPLLCFWEVFCQQQLEVAQQSENPRYLSDVPYVTSLVC